MPSSAFKEVQKLHARRRELDGKTRKVVSYNFAGKLLVTVWNGSDPTHEGAFHTIHSQERYCYDDLVKRCFAACGNCGLFTNVLHTPDGKPLPTFFHFLQFAAESPKPMSLVCIPKGRFFIPEKLPVKLLRIMAEGPSEHPSRTRFSLPPIPFHFKHSEQSPEPRSADEDHQVALHRGYSRPKNAGLFITRPASVNTFFRPQRNTHPVGVVDPRTLPREGSIFSSFSQQKLNSSMGSVSASLGLSFEAVGSFRLRSQPPLRTSTPTSPDSLDVFSPKSIQKSEPPSLFYASRVTRHVVSDIPFPLGIVYNRLGEAIQIDGGEVSPASLTCTDDGELWKVELVSDGIAHARHVLRSADPQIHDFVAHHRDQLGLSFSDANKSTMELDVRSLSFLTDECRNFPVGELHTTLAFPYLFWIGSLRGHHRRSSVETVEQAVAHEACGSQCGACGARHPDIVEGKETNVVRRYVVI